MDAKATSSGWADDLLRPLPLGAVGVLILNDHLWKGGALLPGWLTGKLSDFAGLFFFPLLLVALVQGLAHLARRPIPPSGRVWLGVAATAGTGVVFAAIKLVPRTHAWLPWFVVADSTDLVALVALVPA